VDNKPEQKKHNARNYSKARRQFNPGANIHHQELLTFFSAKRLRITDGTEYVLWADCLTPAQNPEVVSTRTTTRRVKRDRNNIILRLEDYPRGYKTGG